MPDKKSNRDLVLDAIPFQCLTERQWKELLKLIKFIELTDGKESILFSIQYRC